MGYLEQELEIEQFLMDLENGVYDYWNEDGIKELNSKNPPNRNRTFSKRKKILVNTVIASVTLFSRIKTSEAMGGSVVPKTPIVNLYQNGEDVSSKITISKVKLNNQKEPLLIKSEFDLRDPGWVVEFISSIKGGAQDLDSALIESIISKLADSNLGTESVNKVLTRLANAACSVLSNQDLLRVLAELEKPFCSNTFSGIPSLDILSLPQAEGFALTPYQQRVPTRLLAAQKNNDVFLVTQDGTTFVLTDKSTNHLLAKHGHSLKIKDALPPNPNQKPGKYSSIRTRINKANKKQFVVTLSKILQNPKTEVFQDIEIRGVKSNGYYTEQYGDTEQYGGFFIGVHTEGEFAGQVMKAQPISDPQLKKLRKFNKID